MKPFTEQCVYAGGAQVAMSFAQPSGPKLFLERERIEKQLLTNLIQNYIPNCIPILTTFEATASSVNALFSSCKSWCMSLAANGSSRLRKSPLRQTVH